MRRVGVRAAVADAKPPPRGDPNGGNRFDIPRKGQSAAQSSWHTRGAVSDNSRTRRCTRCDLMPVMEPGRGLCGACLGRELLGYASRDEQTAAAKAAWEAGRR
jgi:hypothetical protein